MSDALPQLQVHEVADFVADQGGAGVQLLDVREPWELATARLALPGATLLTIPMGTLPTRLAELDRAQPILVLCHHGQRSLHCVAFLQQQGFDAHNIAGGIDAWSLAIDPTLARY
jgi:rhodanese-related sulfurtransferase